MKKYVIATALAFFVFAMGPAVFALDDLKAHPACKYCGMDREKFAHSRMLIEYEDGTSVGACSLHCAAVELAVNMDKTPKSILVADYNTKQLVEAEKAFWVLGGNKPGVMTKTGKWAFAKKEDAEGFLKENGGRLVGFEDVMKSTYTDMYRDSKMIREKRMMKMKHMGH